MTTPIQATLDLTSIRQKEDKRELGFEGLYCGLSNLYL